MNFTESFDQFSSKLNTMDLALYAGAGLILWVMFKDKMSPIQQLWANLANQLKGLMGITTSDKPRIVNTTELPNINTSPKVIDSKDDIFFKLIVSWKQTRDLAVQSKCSEAVKVIDQMFPFLSPNVCDKKDS